MAHVLELVTIPGAAASKQGARLGSAWVTDCRAVPGDEVGGGNALPASAILQDTIKR